ncbi:MAG: peptide-methionine (S)-S-oxide reductase [Bacteroidetes bacterium]|nr:MAG: peptide-methionine (S)-S-oxide reductase [Bacteroidota bacterium]
MKQLFISIGICVLGIFATTSCAEQTTTDIRENKMEEPQNNLEVVTFGAGCFWCVEAVFEELKGVKSVISGFSGGTVDNPSYNQVISGKTGHAEVCQIEYDPATISFGELLMVFWQTHDPTTLNQQGNDQGTQYRSAVFYHSEEQKIIAEQYMRQLDATGAWNGPIITEITAFTRFYEADKAHQEYYANNPSASYCTYVIQPKLDKFREAFKDKLK